MKKNVAIFQLRVRIALSGLWFVIRRPSSFATFVIATFVVSSFILWSLNLDLVKYIIFEAPITLADKLQFFGTTYRDIFTTFGSAHALGISLFSLLFGLNTALLVFVLKNHGFKDIPKKSGLGGTLMAVLAGGCVACGTSLLAPIAATFGATSSAFLRDFSLWLNWVGSLLIIFSLYKLGQLVSTIRAKQRD